MTDLRRFVANINLGTRYNVYVGRGSAWGNPFTAGPSKLAQFKVATRAEAIARYEEWLLTRPDLMARLPELKGQVLGCFCAPLPCHAEVLARYANLS